jgi:hypothetical protein
MAALVIGPSRAPLFRRGTLATAPYSHRSSGNIGIATLGPMLKQVGYRLDRVAFNNAYFSLRDGKPGSLPS